MTFGCSYSLIYVDCIDWVKTKLWKRLVRGFIGVALAWLIIFGLDKIELDNEYLTKFIWNKAIPCMVIPFFIFGPF